MSINKGKLTHSKKLMAKKSNKVSKALKSKGNKMTAKKLNLKRKKVAIIKSKKQKAVGIKSKKTLKKRRKTGKKATGKPKGLKKSKKGKSAKKGKKLKTKTKRKAPAALIKVMNVSENLAAIIGTKRASRPQCIKALWAYLKKHNLQDSEHRQYFTPDEKMAKVFGNKKMKAIHMSKFLSGNLSE